MLERSRPPAHPKTIRYARRVRHPLVPRALAFCALQRLQRDERPSFASPITLDNHTPRGNRYPLRWNARRTPDTPPWHSASRHRSHAGLVERPAHGGISARISLCHPQNSFRVARSHSSSTSDTTRFLSHSRPQLPLAPTPHSAHGVRVYVGGEICRKTRSRCGPPSFVGSRHLVGHRLPPSSHVLISRVYSRSQFSTPVLVKALRARLLPGHLAALHFRLHFHPFQFVHR